MKEKIYSKTISIELELLKDLSETVYQLEKRCLRLQTEINDMRLAEIQEIKIRRNK